MANKATNEPESVRVRLVFNNVLQHDGLDKMLYLLRFSLTPTVAELLVDIQKRFHVLGSLSCQIDGFFIPTWECTRILREDDVITLSSSSDIEESANKEKELKGNDSLKRVRVTDDQDVSQPKRKKSRSQVKAHSDAESVSEVIELYAVNDVCVIDNDVHRKAKKHKKHKKKYVSDEETIGNELDNTELAESIVAIDSEQTVDHVEIDASDNPECAAKKKRRRRKHAKRSRRKDRDLSCSESENGCLVADTCNESIDTSRIVATTSTPAEGNTTSGQRVQGEMPSFSNVVNGHQTKNTNVAKFRKNKNRRRRMIIPTLTYLQFASTRNANSTETQQSGQNEQPVTTTNNNKADHQNQAVAVKQTAGINGSAKRNEKFKQSDRMAARHARSHIQFASESESEEEKLLQNGDGEAEPVTQTEVCITSETPAVSQHASFGHSGGSVQSEVYPQLLQPTTTVTSSPLDALLDHRVHLVPASSRKKAETTGQVTVFSRAKARQTSVNLNSHPSTSQTANVSSTSLTSNAPPQQPPPRDYTSLPILTSLPSVGDTIAYKVLEITASYSPEISAYKEASVTAVNAAKQTLTMELLAGSVTGKSEAGRFDVIQETDEEILTNVDQSPVVTLHWRSLIEPRLVHPSS